MRHRNVGLLGCCALFFAVVWGTGCAAAVTSAVCSGPCGAPSGPSTPTGASNNTALKGNYAFTFTGMKGNGAVSSVAAAVGMFTSDGAGNLTSGEVDENGVGTGAALNAQAFTGTYTIGADNRGVMTWNLPGGPEKFAFAMTANGNARFIEFDASGGSGTTASGTIESADANAFNMASLTGDYAFGVAGLDNLNNRAAIIGRFSSNGSGALTNAAGDLNAYGTPYTLTFSAASYTVSDTKTGRGTLNLAFTYGGAPANLNFVFYIVNAKRLLAMERDTVTTATPLLNGVVARQQTPSGGFTNASLNGKMVIHLTGLSTCGSGAAGVPKAVAGVITAGGAGSLSLDYDENYCHAPNTVTAFSGTYSVASNGRTTITLGGNALVAYLAGANQTFLFDSDGNVLFGVGEPQTAGPFTNGVVKGTYAGSATDPQSFGVTVFSGEFTADGASTISGQEDVGAASGAVSGEAFNASYSVSSSPTNGKGTMTVSSGTGGNVVFYMISPTKFVALSQNDPNPAILVFEQGPATTPPPPPPPPPAVTLSSLTLNPTSVIGGLESSTGTVTLSAPAPAGGATVALASSNGAASVPSSVTIPAGATSATFTVNTSIVIVATSATISATYNNTTQAATLSVLL